MVSLQKATYLGEAVQLKELGGVIASITQYPDIAIAEKMHCHENFVLSMVLQGGNLEKRKDRSVERMAGTVTCHNPGEPHQSLHMQRASMHINIEVTQNFLEKYNVQPRADMLEKASGAATNFLMLKLYNELLAGDTTPINIEAPVLHLIKFHGKAEHDGNAPAWVKKVREALYDRWDDAPTLVELSAIANLHPVNLSAYFPSYFGCTIGEYRRKIKMEKALLLLGQPSVPLTSIAYECGFADQSHFVRVCKEITGWRPKNLRSLLKNQRH
ncbi:MAG TPA: helix-turn-helix transcriptional regulator [Chitinophagaceae bacterium]|jgi:AraC family transcriptional regulator|nr:helix-turn-helix transcriptional regulator [Chitinophagaceae bacterium]